MHHSADLSPPLSPFALPLTFFDWRHVTQSAVNLAGFPLPNRTKHPTVERPILHRTNQGWVFKTNSYARIFQAINLANSKLCQLHKGFWNIKQLEYEGDPLRYVPTQSAVGAFSTLYPRPCMHPANDKGYLQSDSVDPRLLSKPPHTSLSLHFNFSSLLGSLSLNAESRRQQ
jgi:hypothetical protein